MIYLKCNACGHYNELRSEFLTFCGHCGKKLQQNYPDWKQKNPASSFEDFRQQVAIEHNGAVQAGQERKYLWRTGRRSFMLALILVIGLAAVAGGYFGKQAVFSLLYPRVAKAWLYMPWETVAIGRQAMEISTPVHLGVCDKPIDPEMAPMPEYAKCYRNREEDGMQIEVNMYSYAPQAGNSLEEAAEAAVRSMGAGEEISALRYQTIPVIQAGLNGLLQEGSFLYRNAITLSFCNLVMVRDVHRWQVCIRYRADDPVAQQVARRILQSVKVK